MKKILFILLIIGVVVIPALAQHGVFHKNGNKVHINVTTDDTAVLYTNSENGAYIKYTTFIDGSRMVVNFNSQSSTREIWGSGNGEGNSDVLIQHDFDGSINDTLKGTITIKTPHAITFPYSVAPGYSLSTYGNGLKVVKSDLSDTRGIHILKPTAVNKTGGMVQVWYTFDNQKITLNINDTNQEYPLTIDPSEVPFSDWVAEDNHWKATNDTHTLLMWNATGTHTWDSTGNYTGGASEFLIVAGGGSGGASSGGGGGAGGLLNLINTTLLQDGIYNITVGPGGAARAGSPWYGNDGGTSGISNTTWFMNATGGGGGGGAGTIAARSGGSGGGRSYNGANASGIAGQGNAGGGLTGTASNVGSGGGGYGSVGGFIVNNVAGNGGDGLLSNITGTATFYSCGGGGGSQTSQPYGAGTPLCGGNGGNTTAATAGTASTGGGGGGGASGAASGAGGSGIVIIKYSSASGGTVFNASFTQSPNPSSTGQSVTFTDTSTGTPTTWNWTINDVLTNTTQNMAYIFSTAGSYYVDLNVTNSSGSFSNYTALHTVANASGFTPQDIWMEGQYIETFRITDSSTGLPITTVDLTLSPGGSTYTTTNGTGYLTAGFGAYTVTFISEGYVGKTISYVFDSDATWDVQMVAADTTSPVYNVYPPKDVKFHITSFFGTPITDATVTIQGITTSTGNWDWLVTLLGISLDEVAINGTAMSESTDSNGDAVFLMLPSVKYNITTTATGYTFPTSFIAPQATEYTITANWNESWFSSGNDTLKDVNVSVSWVKFNDTHSFVNITYDDQTMTTTGGTITVYRDSVSRVANASAISTMDITSASCSNSTLVNTPTGGASYKVQVNATTTSGENVVRTFTHSFKGAPVQLPGWNSETLLWLSLFIIIFTAAFAGALHAPQMSVILCVEAWVFWSIGWLDYLISWNGYAEGALLIVLTVATFFTVIWSITEGKAKGKRSS